ncbi:MAG: tRNA (adenosine(37)-N6)-threonylcarbamoyltransferase complex ATPase subunit type 1 TsaE [Ahrensia sp.]|nr:tRNA (adenosine(37)-N6)-threonylcarbamoyltransferase complex ATPase subunit type 1 TsaE [Ahrensia sp.]
MASVELVCHTEDETQRLGETLAAAMRPGLLVALLGDLGAGKTALTRSVIRSAMADSDHEVPSPTFTLVQMYDGLPFGTLAHLDLYRIGEEEEVDELGIDEALDTGVVLVEWPQRAASVLNHADLRIEIAVVESDARAVTIGGKTDAVSRVRRSLDIRSFLDREDYQDGTRRHLTGDASTRAYETVHTGREPTRILMNAPAQPDGPPVRDGKPYSAIAHLAEDVSAFVGVDMLLRSQGFRAPQILASDLDAGLLLIEHLGDGLIIDHERRPIMARYEAAIDLLAALHDCDWPNAVEIAPQRVHHVPDFDREAMLIEVSLLADWYAPNCLDRTLTEEERRQFNAVWNALIDRLEGAERSLVLRDFHSPNIVWNGAAEGHDRVGIIDFQDAMIGPTAYDVASLAQDARIDVSTAQEARLVQRYCKTRKDLDIDAFRQAYAIMAAQRATKVAGIFVRLSKRDGKHVYLDHLPRMEDYIRRTLAHPALADYAEWFSTVFGNDG